MSISGAQIRVVSDLDLTTTHRDRILSAFGNCSLKVIGGEADLAGALDQADIAFLSPRIDPEELVARPHLQWVHIDMSGLERFAQPALLDTGMLITGSAGRAAPVLAEHALMFMLAHAYRLPRLVAAQQDGTWAPEGFDGLRGLFGQCVGIIGMGQTGQELARICKAMNMSVLGYNRSHKDVASVDTLYCGASGDSITSLLEQSDFVVLCLALADATRDMIGAAELDQMKPSACLINIGRGGLIQDEPLIAALKSGRLAGAGLDVFRQEPLPKDSPLWHAPNLLITPHATPGMPDRLSRTVDIIVDNIARFRKGAALRNAIG